MQGADGEKRARGELGPAAPLIGCNMQQLLSLSLSHTTGTEGGGWGWAPWPAGGRAGREAAS